MKKVIGIGRMGGIIADQFSTYPEYRVYKVSCEADDNGATLYIPPCKDMEHYEKEFDAAEAAVYLRSIKSGDDVMVALEGGDPLSGILLRLLSLIQESNISILYLSPDRDLISSIQRRDDKITFGVLQEYARSGVFDRMFLFHRPLLESLMGEAPLDKHESSLAYFLTYTVAMRNYFDNTPPLTNQGGSVPSHARLSTFAGATLDVESELSMFYPVAEICDIHLFYGIPEQDVEGDPSLMAKIKNHIKSVRTPETSVSYSVHATTLEKPLIIGEFYSTKIQSLA